MKLVTLYLCFCGAILLSNAVFHIVNLREGAGAVAWLIALRYAVATTAAALFLPGLVYLLAWRFSAVRRLIFQLAGLALFFIVVLLVGDILYYRQVGKHLTVEFAVSLQNPGDIARMLWSDYRWALVAVALAGGVFFYFWFRRVHGLRFVSTRPLWLRIALLPVFIVASVIAFRGGLQDRPLRPADAYQYLPQREADFALNGAYTAFYTLYHREDFPARGDAETIRLARTLLQSPAEKFIADELPFYRTVKPTAAPLKKNVVFIILESWSAKRIGAFGDKSGATPFFDSLARKSWFFANAFATGRRSIASLPAAISSIPTLYGALYITSPHEQNFQRGMGSIFSAQGYSTFFTYAAKAGSMGFNAFARVAGFDTIVTRESFDRDAEQDGVWGVYDHVTFERVLADIDAAQKPFLSVVYTLHPHPPFVLPPGYAYFKADYPRYQYYNALRYSDETLRQFFAAAESRPWYKDTVFVLTADHAFEEAQGFDAFHVPLLIYAPGFLPPRLDNTIASELDILPTLVDLLRFETRHASMGKSLRAPGERFAFLDTEHAAMILRQKDGGLLALQFAADKYLGYFDMSADKEWRNLKSAAPFADAEMRAMRSYIDVMGHAVLKNRIAPRPN